MKTILRVLVFVLFAPFAFAQPTNNAIDDVVMPAPNAASLGKYGDIPVSYYTGVPSIGVPIHTVTEGPLSLPISLSYHASGVKVAETASWVGLGWALNAGGMVTRTVLDKPDDQNGGFLDFSDPIPDMTVNDLVANRLVLFETIVAGQRDAEADIFSFNVGGYSGKFVLGTDMIGRLMPQQDIKVDVEIGDAGVIEGIVRITLTLPTGDKYHFGTDPDNPDVNKGIEFTNLDSHPHLAPGTAYASTWYLVQIESADTFREINLEYTDHSYSYQNVASCSEELYLKAANGTPILGLFPSGELNGSCTTGNFSCAGEPGNSSSGLYTNQIKIEGKNLSRITTSSRLEVVDFIGGGDRKDLDIATTGGTMPKCLEHIKISTGSNSVFCKDWKFSYSHFQNKTIADLEDKTSYDPDQIRLKLDQVEQLICDEEGPGPVPPYKFTYYNNNGTTNSDGSFYFPRRLSRSIDHWGYYNGAVNLGGSGLNIPYTLVSIDRESGAGLEYIRGNADRETDPEKMKYGSLKRVDYPTGGFTEYTFAANAISEMVPQPLPLVSELTNCIGYYWEDCCPEPNEAPFCVTVEDTQIPTAESVAVGFSYRLDFMYDEDGNFCSSSEDNSSRLILRIFHNNIEVAEEIMNPCFSSSCPPIDPNDPPGVRHLVQEGDLGALVNLVEGEEYRFELEVCNARGVLNVWSDIPVLTDKVVGGLRVEEIRNGPQAEHSNLDLIKTFKYVSADSEDGSSGQLYDEVLYGLSGNSVAFNDLSGTSASGYAYVVRFVDNSIVPLGSFEGYHIAYTRVEEDWNGIGKKIFTYSPLNAPLPISESHFNLITLPQLFTDSEGKLLTENVFELGGSDAVRSVSNDGEELLDTTSLLDFTGLKVARLVPGAACDNETGLRAAARVYTPRTGRYQLNEVEEIIDGVSTITNYQYISPHHFFPTATQTTNSDGKIYRTETKYAQDMGLSGVEGAANEAMIDKYMIGIPIQTKRFVNGNLKGGSLNLHKLFDGFPRPHRQQEIYKDNAIRDLATFGYNAAGNVDSIDRLGQPLITYEWENNLVKTKNVIDWTWTYDYYPNTKMLSSITDLNDLVSSFTYDGLSRLSESSERNGGLTYTFDYNYTLADGGTQNHIRTYDAALKQWTYQYFDGLGRDLQSVKKQYSPDRRDVVNAGLYDAYGRMYLQYLPYEAGGSGAYADPRGPKTRFTFEASPLSRETKRTFADNTNVMTSYACNAGGEVANFTSGSPYAACSLYKQTVTDENGNKTETFTDKIGQLILTRRYVDEGQKVDTYNKYDGRGNLVGVMPPETSSSNDPAAYKYTYDIYNRLEDKKIPGAGVQSFTYDNQDRLSSSTDAESNTLSYSYDDYSRQKTVSKGATILLNNTYDEGSGATNGKLTKEEVANLDGGNGALPTVYKYDNYGRLTSTNVANHLSGVDGFNSHYYGATDIVLSKSTIHNGYIKVKERYTYDHSFRLKETWHKINRDPWVLLSDQGYNHRDELIGKGIGGEHDQFLQSIGYGYNVRGWLTGINLLPLSKDEPPITFDGACIGDDILVDSQGECGLDINLEQLFDLRMLENINLNCFDPCEGEGPILTGAGGMILGDEGDLATQQAAMEQISGMMANTSAASLTYPTSIYHVELLGESKLLLEEELNVLEGDFVIDQCQELPGLEQTVGVILEDGTVTVKSAGQLLTIRQEQTPIFTNPTCNPGCALNCTPQESEAQTGSLIGVNNVVLNANIAAINFPTNLLYVELCNGDKRYLLDSEVDLLSGSYAVLQKVTIFNAGQVIDIVDDLIGAVSVNLATILEHRKNGIDFLVDGFGCDVAVNSSTYEACTYDIYHENWSYTNIENGRDIEVKYEQVVTRDCGSGAEEIRRESITELLPSSKKNKLWIDGSAGANGLTNNLGYLDKLALKMANPDSLLIVDLNPSSVFTTYSGLAGQFPASDLVYSFLGINNGQNTDFINAIRAVIDYAIVEWSGGSGNGILTYDLGLEQGYIGNAGMGTLAITFSNWHNPTGPYANLKEGESYLTYYPVGTAPNPIQLNVVLTEDAGSTREFSYQNYNTPCGIIDASYQDDISDASIPAWNTIPINSPNPQLLSSNFPQQRICNGVALVDGFSSSCTTPLYLYNGSHLEVCGTNGPIYPIPGDSTLCPETYTFGPSGIYGSTYYAGPYVYPEYDLPNRYPGSTNSFTDDNQIWVLEDVENGEAAWEIGIPRYILELDPVTAYEVKIDIPYFEPNTGGSFHFSLLANGNPIPINGGQDQVFFSTTGVLSIQPDVVPTIDQMEQMELVMYTLYPGSLGIESVKIELTNNPCGTDDPPVEECNILEQITAVSVEANTAFSNDLNQTLSDLRDYHVSYGLSQLDDDIPWALNNFSTNDYTLAECSWDVGRPFLDASGIVITSWSASMEIQDWVIENNLTVKVGLAIEDELIPLDNGATSVVVNQAGTVVLTPGTLPTLEAVENLHVVLMVDLTNFNGSSGEFFSIDAVWADLEYTGECSPCYVPTPNCSPAEMIDQYNSLQEINQMMLQIANIGSGNPILTTTDGQGVTLTFPLALNRVRLCSGDIIYLLDHELDRLVGDYYVEQVMMISGWSEVFSVRSDPGAGGGGGASGEPALEIPDLFAMEFHYYDENQPLDAPSQYNGNIAWTKWQVKGRPANYYGYRYDELDRLKKGTFAEDLIGQGMAVTNKYTVDSPEQYIKYDKRGNIQKLRRAGGIGNCSPEGGGFGWGMVDQLDYSYNASNQLTTLTDANDQDGGIKYQQSDFKYDLNGNLTEDPGKEISDIDYNHLNLPNKVTFTSGSTENTIEFSYDAKGTKQTKQINGSVVKEYLPSGVEYNGDKIEAIYHAEGRAIPMYNPVITDLIDSFRYEYVLRDHLGNGRVYFSDLDEDSYVDVGGVASEVTQEEHYYPFGLNHEGPFYATQPVANQYQYNGKELNEEFSLNWLDYGARFYDPAVGRFPSIDPLADMFSSQSPYNYSYNNPIRFTDPDGMAPSPYTYDWDSGEYKNGDGNSVGFDKVKNSLKGSGDLISIIPETTSGDVANIRHGRNGSTLTKTPSAISDFVNTINKFAETPGLLRNSKNPDYNDITVFIDIPYTSSMRSGQVYLNRWRESDIKRIRSIVANYPDELKNAINVYLDGLQTQGVGGTRPPRFQLNGIVEGFQYTIESLKESGVKVDYNLKVRINAVRSPCDEGVGRCSKGHPPSLPTRIYLEFKGRPNGA